MAFPRGGAAWARRHIYIYYRPARSGLQISQSGAVRPEGGTAAAGPEDPAAGERRRAVPISVHVRKGYEYMFLLMI